MKEAIHIRQCGFPNDFIPVVELWHRSAPGVQRGRSDTEIEIAKKQEIDPDLLLVAEHRGKIIGTMMGAMMVGEASFIISQFEKIVADKVLGKIYWRP